MKKTTKAVRKTAKKAPRKAKMGSVVKRTVRKPSAVKKSKKAAAKTLYKDNDILVKKVGRKKIEICAK